MVVKNRFIFYRTNALIEDYMFYTAHPEIDKWLDDHGCLRQGMVIHFFEKEVQILFKLAWS